MNMTVSAQANPFKRTTIIIMFVIGFAAFVALLYGLGSGNRLASGNNGQAHGASHSFVGYKALADLMEKTGVKVQYSRTQAGMDDPGLLILTPNPGTKTEDLNEVMQGRSYVGPTMIILPKWQVAKLPTLKRGWVARGGIINGEVGEAMLKDIADVEITNGKTAKKPKKNEVRKYAAARSAITGSIKTPASPVTMKGEYIRAVVRSGKNSDALVAYLDDGGVYAQLDSLDETQITDEEDIDASYYPLVIVADADLMNNAGMADRNLAKHALALIEAASTGSDGTVTFDLTFNGLGSPKNLLTLAFEPPLLSATICLIAAALAAAWMAFNRFGPPASETRSINFGKTALVNNSAGFIKRMQREYLAAEPYAEMIRGDCASSIGISADAEDDEIDRKLDALGEHQGYRFSALYRALSRAQNARETADRAAALYDWKKEKIG